jgi:hypothetical protein
VTRAGSLGALLLLAALAVVAQEETAAVDLRVEPDVARVGDPIALTLTVALPAGARLDARALGPDLGPFSVLDGRWEPVSGDTPASSRVWQGRIAAYEVGELELPPIRVEFKGADGKTNALATESRTLTLESVLALEEGPDAALADLKAPASVAADFRVLWIAGVVLLGMLLLALLAWWLVRRYGRRFEAVPAPTDPFHRVAPHVWAYGELQKLLDERLAEDGEVDRFCTRLSWILKRYLGGRFRIDLMEHTTAEVPALLARARAPEEPSESAHRLLERCDGVKFARATPTPEQCRAEVEEAYRVIDATRVSVEPAAAAERGVA